MNHIRSQHQVETQELIEHRDFVQVTHLNASATVRQLLCHVLDQVACVAQGTHDQALDGSDGYRYEQALARIERYGMHIRSYSSNSHCPKFGQPNITWLVQSRSLCSYGILPALDTNQTLWLARNVVQVKVYDLVGRERERERVTQ
jgi:hypothetical protein